MKKELPEEFSKTLIIWWRYGKEHEGDEFKINSSELVDAHLKSKYNRFRNASVDPGRWWQVDPDLIIERPPPGGQLFGDDSRIYYLLNRGLTVIENVHLPPPDDNWTWYIRICDFSFSDGLNCWLMKDLFCDIVVENDNRTYHLFDLPDMAQALDVGLITTVQSGEILKRIDQVVNAISEGRFPLEEIVYARAAADRMGW
jgi:hypothetical protein